MKRIIFIFVTILMLFGLTFSNLQAQESSDSDNDVVTDLYGFEMVYVPSGIVQMGINTDEFVEMMTDGIFSDYSGINTFAIEESYGVFETYETTVQGFWMDKYEVTVDEYERIVLQCFSTNTCPDDYLPQLLTWDEAVRFCAGRGARLPMEQEWEYAASGSDNLIFPWGNELLTEAVDFQDYIGFELYDVGSRPLNVSWAGIFDMVGNAEEWTDDLFQPYYSWGETSLTDWNNVNPEFWRVVRGGAPEDAIMLKTTYSRQGSFYGTAGVRCVRFSHPSSDYRRYS